jgi:hypothetical protein
LLTLTLGVKPMGALQSGLGHLYRDLS